MPALRLVLLGAPGSGKGTQGELLERELGIPRISPGDMLRQEVAAGSELGQRVKSAMERGVLVEDAVIIDIMRKRFDRPDCRDGYILDGFPRSQAQASALEQMLTERGEQLSGVLNMEVPKDDIVERIAGRMTCADCGAAYHRRFSPPKVEGVCDRCGGKQLMSRSDDNEQTVRSRLDVYLQETMPLVEYYRARGLLRNVSATGSIRAVSERMNEAIQTLRIAKST